jgi:hypothetical protein
MLHHASQFKLAHFWLFINCFVFSQRNQLILAKVLQQLVYQYTHWLYKSSVTVQKALVDTSKLTQYTCTTVVHQDHNITNMDALQLNWRVRAKSPNSGAPI